MTDFTDEITGRLKNPHYLLLLGILAMATFLRFRYAFFDGLWVDEGRYGRIAKELSTHILDYSVVWRGQITSYPPVYPYLLAVSTYIFGKTDLAVRVVSPLMGVAGVGLTYLLGREMKTREIGLIAAAVVAVNPIFWFLSERILIGATFATLYTAAMLALYYGLEDREYSRYALWALGPLVSLNIMTKQPAYTLGVVIPLYFLYVHREELESFVVRGTSFRESGLYDVFTDRDYYTAAGLGLLTLLPWMLRNTAVCSFPLCGLPRALDFAATTNQAAWASTQGPFYYILSMPGIMTALGTALVGLRVIQYIVDYADRDADTMVKAASTIIGLLATSYFLKPDLVPMVLLTSIAIFARSDAEKLLWLWAGIGIGFMSLGRVQVPRYIVFVIPALATVAAISLYSVSDWLAYQLDSSGVTAARLAVVLMVPVLFLSFAQGMQNISRGGYTYLEPAGEWLDSNLPEEANVGATSDPQMRYYIYPRMAYTLPKNQSKFKSFLREKNITHVEVDVYERAQAKWAQTGLPPYRLPVSTVQDLRAGRISPQQVGQSYGKPPGYLERVKSFGRTRVPLTQDQQQPMVIIYRVNLTG
ncbi:MAG: ArnT family glycosyltransferase [Candidatus Nanohaloarchaea archaeon]